MHLLSSLSSMVACAWPSVWPESVEDLHGVSKGRADEQSTPKSQFYSVFSVPAARLVSETKRGSHTL